MEILSKKPKSKGFDNVGARRGEFWWAGCPEESNASQPQAPFALPGAFQLCRLFDYPVDSKPSLPINDYICSVKYDRSLGS